MPFCLTRTGKGMQRAGCVRSSPILFCYNSIWGLSCRACALLSPAVLCPHARSYDGCWTPQEAGDARHEKAMTAISWLQKFEADMKSGGQGGMHKSKKKK